MKIAFHTNQLSLRGTEVAMYDYAKYNEEILGNESIVISQHPEISQFASPLAVKKFESRFPTFYYRDKSEIDNILYENDCDRFYAQKAGFSDGIVASAIPTLVHAVFQYFQPHGSIYAYISEWLGNQYNMPFVPYMVDLPVESDDLRKELGIPADAIVFGRHGGRETFDLKFAQDAVKQTARTRPDIYFLFLNTDRFSDEKYENIIYLEGTSSMVYKTKFINTCNAMLHARAKGESFGLAIGEFSIKNRRIITYSKAIDKAHFAMLGDEALYYDGYMSLMRILNQGDFRTPAKNCYTAYTPEQVMKKFREVFLR